MRQAMSEEGLADLGQDGDDDPEPQRRSAAKHSARQTVFYRVGPGDTLIGVARQFAADIEDVARDNDIEVDSKLRAGSLMKLRVRADVVRLGDTGSPEETPDQSSSADDTKSDRAASKKKSQSESSQSDHAHDKGKKQGQAVGAAKRRHTAPT